MDPEKKKTIFTICCIAVIIVAAVLLVFGGRQSEPPMLKISNGTDSEIEAQRGTYSWKTGGLFGESQVTADSPGPLHLYKIHGLAQIKPSENDDCSLTLKFDKDPESVSIEIYSESAADAQDYGKMIPREVTAGPSEYKFTVPQDGIYIVDVCATWTNGCCHYYFYTTN